MELEGQRYQVGHTREYLQVRIPYLGEPNNRIVSVKALAVLEDGVILGGR